MRFRPFALLVAVAAATTAARASAEPEEPIHLDYVAPSTCPSREEFEALVQARTARARFVVASGETRVFDVRIKAGPRGRVTVRRGASVEGTREVRAETCSDVADALALVVALAVDPAALVARPEPPAPAAEPPAPVAEPPAPVEAPPSPAPASADRRSPSPRPRRRALSFGTDLAVLTGTAPGTLVGVSPHVGWASSAESWLVPSARLGFLHAATGAVDLPGGGAVFAWNVGSVDGCATAWPAKPVRVSVCGHVEAGVVDAAGLGVPASRSQTRGWVGVGPLLRGEWTFASPLFVEAEVATTAHLVADRFLFLPDTTAYRVPILGLSGSLGLGVFFL